MDHQVTILLLVNQKLLKMMMMTMNMIMMKIQNLQFGPNPHLGILTTPVKVILKLSTDLGSLIGNTQCGNFRIIPPLRFYLREINYGHFKARENGILTILEALNFEFLGI